MLHTWGQQLWRHVHVHCLIPGGALDEAGLWQAARGNYLFPDRALARHFRGCMVSELRQAYSDGELALITEPDEVDAKLEGLMGIDWVVYTKPWLRKPETVVEYLARNTYRTDISDARIGEISDGEVAQRYKDYRDKDRWKTLHLPGAELIRRFLLHILPKGFMRIRHFGFLANRCRKEKLAKTREVLGQAPETSEVEAPAEAESRDWPCPKCHQGQMRVFMTLAPVTLSGG